MKKMILSMLLGLSLNAFGQSYMIMENGVVLTTDQQGFVYDFGHYALPQDVTLRGGRFFVEDSTVLAVVDDNGFLHRSYQHIPEKIRGRGINYFLSSLGELFTIDGTGAVHYFQDDRFKRAENFGGIYFTVRLPEQPEPLIFTISADGQVHEVSEVSSPEAEVEADGEEEAEAPAGAEAENLKSLSIAAFGGNYFMSSKSVLHTVASTGEVKAHPNAVVGVFVKRGGNYFTDAAGIIFTVTVNGDLIVPGIPLNFDARRVTRTGSNYFMDVFGRLYVVDRAGNIFEKNLQDHKLKDVSIISL
jgi:hypothetical protein